MANGEEEDEDSLSLAELCAKVTAAKRALQGAGPSLEQASKKRSRAATTSDDDSAPLVPPRWGAQRRWAVGLPPVTRAPPSQPSSSSGPEIPLADSPAHGPPPVHVIDLTEVPASSSGATAASSSTVLQQRQHRSSPPELEVLTILPPEIVAVDDDQDELDEVADGSCPPPEPLYKRLWRNHCNADLRPLDCASEGCGRCLCQGSCELDTRLNALTSIECCSETCAFGDQVWLCKNRQFAAAEAGEIDDHFEVFYTGSRKGFGLRAAKPLLKDHLVAEYLGEVVPQAFLQTWRYAMLLKTGVALDASKAGGPARFMNHSCIPNCSAQRWVAAGHWRVGIFADRDISPGEELCFSYAQAGRGGFGPAGLAQLCFCGADGCRGFIGAPNAKLTHRRRSALQHDGRRSRMPRSGSCQEVEDGGLFQHRPKS